MPEQKQRCRLGFSCSLMMQQVGIDASICANRSTCGTLTRAEPTEEAAEILRLELIRVEQAEWGEERLSLWIRYLDYLEAERQSLRLSRSEAAIAMLLQRAFPQTLSDFGVTELLQAITGQLERLEESLRDSYSEFHFIAAPEVEAHHYWATGSGGRYQYNKLQASEPIFAPASESRHVRMIHLSTDDDPRNREARKGIERRNRLQATTRSLRQISASLDALVEELQEEV